MRNTPENQYIINKYTCVGELAKNTNADGQIYISQGNVNACGYQIKNFLILSFQYENFYIYV